MKKFTVLLISFFLFNCANNSVVNSCFSGVVMNETINLSNPQFIDIQVPGGYTYVSLGGRNLLIIRRTDSSFKAYDRQCPERDCSSSMTFDGLKLICPCSDKEYNSLNGSPLDGEGCFALEYTTILVGDSTLQISI